MRETKCLNCKIIATGNYCANCGQKTSTHRFSLSNIGHDLMHILHVEKGLFYTLKMLITRPGYAVREFVDGERIRYFNYLTLLLLLIAVDSFIDSVSGIRISDIMPGSVDRNHYRFFEDFARKYPKLMVLGLIPVYAATSWLFFRKARQNYAEHLVLNAYRACGEFLIAMTISVTALITKDISILRTLYFLVTVVLVCYNILYYYQYFRPDYTRKRAALGRSILAVVAINVFLSLVSAIISFALPSN